MNKNDISRKIHEAHGGLSYVEAQKIVNFILETMKDRLSSGEKVLLSGFGCFSVMPRKTKRGVNPQTGAPIVISGRNSVKFKPSKYLKTI
ncbi:MAG: HU family DNA-binding protein [Acidobacteriota bacterium]|jgi:DNA-binding protein HU-beta|nr:HU family DNA-binding protein [Acidobacteriota bacterium]